MTGKFRIRCLEASFQMRYNSNHLSFCFIVFIALSVFSCTLANCDLKMSLSRVATLDAVKLQEFLNTVVKSIAEHRGGPSRVKLIEQTKRSYFPESTERNTELNDEITQVEDIFIHAAHESMDAVKFEQTFKSTDLSSGQKKIFIDTWNTNKEQVFAISFLLFLKCI